MFRLSEAEFKKIYDAHIQYACHFALPYLRNSNAVDEVVQTAFIKLYSSLNRFKKQSSLKTYFTRILIHAIYDFIKQKKHSHDPFDEQQHFIDHSEVSSTDISNALSKLTLQQMTCVQLYYYSDFSTQSIADLLNVTVGTVKTQLSRSRKKIRCYLELKETPNE